MRRLILPLGLLAAARILLAQEALDREAVSTPAPNGIIGAGRAWLDLRQNSAPGSVQAAPGWVDSVTFVAAENNKASEGRSVFRIRVSKPADVSNVLFFRLFFKDISNAGPEIVAWDESGSQLLRSGQLGTGVEVESSAAVMIPMHGVSTIDVEVPGDGKTVRGAYLEWMASSELVHPLNSGAQDSVPQPFASSTILPVPERDAEQFGTVTASLAAQPVRIGATTTEAATFEFGMESQPLLAMISFEIAAPTIDSPPELIVNGQNVGPVSFSLPALADPGYRGEMRSLLNQMQFQYTGWLRAQKIVPVGVLQSGGNSITVVNGPNAGASVIRSIQIELKYLWEKSDYILKPER